MFIRESSKYRLRDDLPAIYKDFRMSLTEMVAPTFEGHTIVERQTWAGEVSSRTSSPHLMHAYTLKMRIVADNTTILSWRGGGDGGKSVTCAVTALFGYVVSVVAFGLCSFKWPPRRRSLQPLPSPLPPLPSTLLCVAEKHSFVVLECSRIHFHLPFGLRCHHIFRW